MSFTERKGDLFAADDLDALAHGVNCQGVMGAGFAKLVAQRYPKVLNEYRIECRRQWLSTGSAQTLKATDDPDDQFLVFNLATQQRPGPDAKLRYVASSMALMLETAEALSYVNRIGMPRIGCGIGGLDWIEVRMIVETLANESSVDIVVFSL